jgi:hypothetical protein
MNEKTIKSEIHSGLKNGKSKRELYEEYSQTIDDTLLRKILASTPSHDVKNKFRLLHKTICWIWVLIFTLELLGSLEQLFIFDIKSLISLALFAYLLVQLWKFNGDIYLPAICWLIWGIFNSVKEQINLPNGDLDYDALIIISWLYILLMLTTISLMYIVRKNVFGYYEWFKLAHDQNNKIVFQEE